jgi:hypothetical protein
MNLLEVQAIVNSKPFDSYLKGVFQDALGEDAQNWRFKVQEGARRGHFAAWLVDIGYGNEWVATTSVFQNSTPTGWYVRQSIKRTIKQANKRIAASLRKELASL